MKYEAPKLERLSVPTEQAEAACSLGVGPNPCSPGAINVTLCVTGGGPGACTTGAIPV